MFRVVSRDRQGWYWPGSGHLEQEKWHGPVAQLVEQLTFNQWVTGSNPVGLTTFP